MARLAILLVYLCLLVCTCQAVTTFGDRTPLPRGVERFGAARSTLPFEAPNAQAAQRRFAHLAEVLKLEHPNDDATYRARLEDLNAQRLAREHRAADHAAELGLNDIAESLRQKLAIHGFVHAGAEAAAARKAEIADLMKDGAPDVAANFFGLNARRTKRMPQSIDDADDGGVDVQSSAIADGTAAVTAAASVLSSSVGVATDDAAAAAAADAAMTEDAAEGSLSGERRLELVRMQLLERARALKHGKGVSGSASAATTVATSSSSSSNDSSSGGRGVYDDAANGWDHDPFESDEQRERRLASYKSKMEKLQSNRQKFAREATFGKFGSRVAVWQKDH